MVLLFVSSFCLMTLFIFFFQAEDGIRDWSVTGVQTCALPIYHRGERGGLAATGRAGHEHDAARGFGDLLDLFEQAEFLEAGRSEERRVGKECRSRWWREQ